MVLIDKYISGNKQTATNTPQSPISADEDAKIKQWVNQTYSGQSEAYKKAAYKDAYDAVLERKQANQKRVQNEVRRQVNANTASYKGNDKVKQEEAKVAKAEKAIADAAEIIREGQRANGVKVNDNLTDRQTVDSFLLANNGKPYAEYVAKYIDNNMNGRAGTNNLWLAAKLGLDTGSTLGISNNSIINAGDKLEAGIRGFGQGVVNLTQNTIGRLANYAGSNLGAGLGELGYSVANLMGADTSEGSVWDKLKKAKGYSWSEAGDAANSKLGEKGMILGDITSEDKGAYNIGEGLGETASEIALTAPMGLGAGTAISKSGLGTAAKLGLQGLNAGVEGAAFQLADDLSNKEKVDNLELSSPGKYAQTAILSGLTAGAANGIGKLAKLGKTIPRRMFGASDRIENAILKKTVNEWDKMSEISKGFAKDANAAATPYTELAKPLKQAKETLDIDRLNKGSKLQEVRQNLKYIGKDRKTGSMYTREDVKDDLNAALKNLADKKKYGKAAKEVDQIPQFEIKDGNLALSEKSLNDLNEFELKGVSGTDKDIKLGDEIMKLYKRVYGMGGKDNATNTHAFIQELKSLYKKGWSGGNPNVLRETLNSLDTIETKFNNSLTSKSLKNLQTYSKLDEEAINLSNDFDKLIGAMDKGSVDEVKAAMKSLKGNASIEELFKKVKDATGVDMNNEVLSWAYNLSLYDVSKAKDLLSTFYPSKAGMIEVAIEGLSRPARQRMARQQIASGIKTEDMPKDADVATQVFTQIANIIGANQ